MSYELSITTEPAKLPTGAAWNAALSRHGFELVLDEIDFTSQSGFLPAKLLGRRTGFELYIDPVEPPRRVFGLAKGKSSQVRVTARVGGYHLENAAASAALAVLHELTDGAYSDDNGHAHTPQEFLDAARAQYFQIRILLHRLDTGAAAPATEPPLAPGETRELRQSAIADLTELPMLVAEGNAYALHKNLLRDLQKEISELEAS